MKTKRLFSAPVGDEVALRDQAKALHCDVNGQPPDREHLREVSRQKGVDLATCFFYESLVASRRHGDLIRRIDSAPVEPATGTATVPLVIVPGMFYREYPEIGADGQLLGEIATRFGIRSSLVPAESLGSVAQNVEILHEHLSTMPAGPFWLASMSRGSAEVKLLLHKYADAPYLRHLRAWISICGIVAGSPLLERVYANPVYAGLHSVLARIYGVSAGLARELLASNEHWQPTRCPPGASIINVVAVPLSWHVTGGAIRRYRRICHMGPTDGVVLLESYLGEPGSIYPLWGVDHFLRTPRIPALFYRLLNHLLVQERRQHEQTTSGPDDSGHLRSCGDGAGHHGS